ILSLFKPHLTERQKLELATMQEVWFFTLDGEGSSRGGVKNGEFDDDDNNYILVQNEHFYYRFQLDRKIGQGGQSVVVRCLDHKTRTMVALKILASPSTSREEKHQRTELLMSMELQSDRSNVDYNVVRVLETFYFRGHKCLVMELLKAKLHCVLRQMTLWQSHEDAVRSYTRAILHFLAHTKSRGIVHGDIKPSNVLLANIADGIVRVRNFASSFFVDGKTSHVGGTLAYVAPEVLLGYPATCAVDTWSLGCTVAKLATDRELFLSFSRDDHLACCIEILGMPPKEMVEKARKRAAYFDEAGQPHCPARKRLPASVPLHLVLRGCGAQLVAFISSCLHEATPATTEATPTTIEATTITSEAFGAADLRAESEKKPPSSSSLSSSLDEDETEEVEEEENEDQTEEEDETEEEEKMEVEEKTEDEEQMEVDEKTEEDEQMEEEEVQQQQEKKKKKKQRGLAHMGRALSSIFRRLLLCGGQPTAE
uniref:Dual specificity tyrosine-phosphorylation-regulated kinase 4-like n=1 Tax=Petromyzon marinus TaxID=7757 RepID=A0AAJ7WR82_PETMA